MSVHVITVDTEMPYPAFIWSLVEYNKWKKKKERDWISYDFLLSLGYFPKFRHKGEVHLACA